MTFSIFLFSSLLFFRNLTTDTTQTMKEEAVDSDVMSLTDYGTAPASQRKPRIAAHGKMREMNDQDLLVNDDKVVIYRKTAGCCTKLFIMIFSFTCCFFESCLQIYKTKKEVASMRVQNLRFRFFATPCEYFVEVQLLNILFNILTLCMWTLFGCADYHWSEWVDLRTEVYTADDSQMIV
jgi:hypothetical protein